MYTGTLINDLLAAVERVSKSARLQPKHSSSGELALADGEAVGSEAEQFPQAFGLSSADGNLGLLLVVHPKLVRALEPGDNLANAIDVDEVGAVSPPE
jgi:hypothetical protein